MPAQLHGFAIRIASHLVYVTYPLFSERNTPAASNAVEAA